MTSTRYAITAVDVRSVKRVRHIHIEPKAEDYLLLIAGNNANGKTSFMDALSIALHGADALPLDPIRHGDADAEINVDLNDGAYRIRRTIGPPKGKAKTPSMTLTITGPEGKLSSPQGWLDNLIRGRFVDPIDFITKSAKDQRLILLAMLGIDVDAMDQERDRLFKGRTLVGRDLKAAQGQRDRMSEPDPMPAMVRSIAEIQADQTALEQDRRKADEARAYHAACVQKLGTVDQLIQNNQDETARIDSEIERLEAALVAARSRREASVLALAGNQERRAQGVAVVAAAAAKLADDETIAAFDARRDALNTEAASSVHYGRWQSATQIVRRQIAVADEDIVKHKAVYEEMSAAIDAIDATKKRLLAEADMPVSGLEVTDDGLHLNGAVFSNASQAEQLACALAIAQRQSPNLKDVWVRDGSRVDDDALDALREWAKLADCRIWVERVGERDPGAIIIRDGKVKPTQAALPTITEG